MKQGGLSLQKRELFHLLSQHSFAQKSACYSHQITTLFFENAGCPVHHVRAAALSQSLPFDGPVEPFENFGAASSVKKKRCIFMEVRQYLSLLLWPSSYCLHGCSLSWTQVGIQRNLHNFWEFQAAGWRPVTQQILSDLGSPAWPFPGACSKPEYPPKNNFCGFLQKLILALASLCV